MSRPGALLVALWLVLPSVARADDASAARQAMREAAIEKADLTPPPLVEVTPPDPRRAPASGAQGAAANGGAKPVSPAPHSDGKSPPATGAASSHGAARAELHRLALDAVVRDANLVRDPIAVGPSTTPAPRAADSNASANGLAHSAAAAAQAASARKLGVGGSNGVGNGNGGVGNGNGNGNGKH